MIRYKQNKCLVCNRIPAKIVFGYAHMIFNDLDRETIHQIASEAVKIINIVDQKDRIFFCGKSHARILSGLFYLLGIKYNCHVSQRAIANAIKSSKSLSGSIDTRTVVISYRDWLRWHPEFFKHDPDLLRFVTLRWKYILQQKEVER